MCRWGLTLLVLLVPAGSWAADVPDRLLSADTQVYLRWDGSTAHQAAFVQTALGKVVQGDCAEFIAAMRTTLDAALIGGANQ
jgi:hypothetical protein